MRREGWPKMRRGKSAARRAGRGFTMIELLVVIAIIGILLAFILAASFASVEQARVRATQALITKLEVALNERVDALLSQTLSPNGAHQWLASVAPIPGAPAGALPWGLVSNPRAEVIARYDLIKMELPDVFFIQGDATTPYPINFAGLPYNYDLTGSLRGVNAPADYVLPLGQSVPPGFNPSPNKPNPAGPPFYTANELDPDGNGTANLGPGAYTFGPVPTGLGIYGASYNARAALQKLIGFTPLGTDGVDNDGNGLADEVAEGLTNQDGTGNPEAQAGLQRFLANHQHQTARAEMLYAILVEGQGPLGNAFNREDFTTNEVKDTDEDGLPEFVDGWGKPLQFYRWPIFYNSDGLQKGPLPFFSNIEPRPSAPLDPTGQIVAPAWWGELMDPPNIPVLMSPKAQIFSRYFGSTVDPNMGLTNPSSGLAYAASGGLWDRSGFYARRAFSAKFLILSAGPDQQYGTIVYSNADLVNLAAVGGGADGISVGLLGNPVPSNPTASWAPDIITVNGTSYWLAGENWGVPQTVHPLTPPDSPQPWLDDIDSHNLQNKAGGIQ